MCSGPEIESASAEDAPRRWRPNRRTLVKAGATFAALAATFGATRGEPDRVTAQQGQSSGSGSTKAQRWSADEQTGSVAAADADGYRIAQAQFPFYALGASWEGSFGAGPTLEFRFSTGGAFGEPVFTSAAVEDGYRPNRDGRIFTHLVFVDGATAVQYRALDGKATRSRCPGSSWSSSTPLTARARAATSSPQRAARPCKSRPSSPAPDGAPTRSLRFDAYGEIWPREYQLVEKVIVHHTVTQNNQDTYATVRSIYYYHAVEQGWGDIGYNYLVGHDGRIFEGRVGGDNVVGGHSFQYGFGSSGISCLGTFDSVDVSASCWSSLIAIVAWTGRNLDPQGSIDLPRKPEPSQYLRSPRHQRHRMPRQRALRRSPGAAQRGRGRARQLHHPARRQRAGPDRRVRNRR